ncbi:pickpocket protein 28-like [Schistocerca americana]|uniref:pickpocket protein 28-like n=1 Tax=Schistocerca americana TaxID=7009 RepID=UPI001F4F94E0|nr:pickpocket protein 28-like [Schistocerca americana]
MDARSNGLGPMEPVYAAVDRDPTAADRKRTTLLQKTWAYFKEYCVNTSLHGLKYVGEDRCPLAQRLFWLLTFLVSLIVCCVFIWNAKLKWDTTPVIVTLADSSYPVGKVPFPAVTICSETKLQRSFFDFTQAYQTSTENRTEEQTQYLGYASLICDGNKMLGANTTDEDAIEFLLKAAPKLAQTLLNCSWHSEDNCSCLFDTVLTDEGICFTFNSIAYDDFFTDKAHQNNTLRHSRVNQVRGWSLDEGYTGRASEAVYPRRTVSAGAAAGLTIVTSTDDQNIDANCRWPVQGFKMLLHSPGDFPNMKTQFFRIPVDRDVVVSVQPRVMMTSEALHSYSPDGRRCYFSSERSLYFFRYYSEENCMTECLANFTVQRCGCAAYYMPRKKNVPICGGARMRCIKIGEDDFYGSEGNLADCHCLPGCMEIKYTAEISHSQILWHKYFEQKPEEAAKFENKTHGKTVIYFKNSHFIPSHRSELYGFTTFMANCGGLLGLFLGFSVLSLIEFIYFLTARALCYFS